MEICCSENLESNYCPHCGKESANQNPLNSLLVHCIRSLNGSENRRIGERERAARRSNDPEFEKCDEKHERTSRAKVAKWTAWVDALRVAIDASKEKTDA